MLDHNRKRVRTVDAGERDVVAAAERGSLGTNGTEKAAGDLAYVPDAKVDFTRPVPNVKFESR